MSGSARSPWAVCRAAQKKYGFSEAKYERCVMKVKLGKTRGRKTALGILRNPPREGVWQKIILPTGAIWVNTSSKRVAYQIAAKWVRDRLGARQFQAGAIMGIVTAPLPKWLTRSARAQIESYDWKHGVFVERKHEFQANREPVTVPVHNVKRNPMRGGSPIESEGFSWTKYQIDEKMFAKGYKYKLIPLSGRFEPLYSKTISGVAELHRMYPDERFNVVSLSAKRNPLEPPKIWRQKKRGRKTLHYRGPDPRYRTYYAGLYAPPWPERRMWWVATRSLDTLPASIVGKVRVISARTEEEAIREAICMECAERGYPSITTFR